MTINTTATRSSGEHASLLTGADVLAIGRAVTNVAYYGAPPDAADRQALALLTYWPGCKPLAQQTIRHIFDGCPLPLNERRTDVLRRTVWRLPNATGLDRAIYNALVVARDADTVQTALTFAGEAMTQARDGEGRG